MTSLCIELLSPVCPGSGMGRAGIVDRDVTFNREGIPYIPARRLKGLLRDALIDLGACAELGVPDPDAILGAPGARASAAIRIGSARVEFTSDGGIRDEVVESRLRQLFDEAGSPFNREDVIRQFTEIRRQTKMERKTGVPAKDTLRGTRVLRAGLRFRSEITGLDPVHKDGVALGAAAIQSLGASRSRGIGDVRCWIEEDGRDLTAAAVESIVEGKPNQLPNTKAALAGVSSYSEPPLPRTDPEYLLRFVLELRENAIFPNLEGDPNTVLTSDSIPGSAFRGLFANAYLRLANGKADEFYTIFCSGRVLFLGAYPLMKGGRGVPIPLSIRRLKRSHSDFLDLTRVEAPEEGMRRAGGFYVLDRLVPDRLMEERRETATQLQYHHQRSSNRLRGRATEPIAGNEENGEKPGTLFTYESILGGQTFEGAVLGGHEELVCVRSLIPDGSTVLLGRSKGAQYGGAAELRWLADPQKLDGLREAAAWKQPATSHAVTDRLVVTLLSPLLSLNEYGHPVPVFPSEELATALSIDQKSLRLESAFTRTRWQGGYLAHQGLPRQQMPSLQEGSVLIFRCREKLDAKRMEVASRRSYGLRPEDGFGRIEIVTAQEPERTQTFRFPVIKDGSSDTQFAPGTAAHELAVGIFRAKALEKVAMDARRLASAPVTTGVENVSNHLLSRLISMAENGSAAELQTAVAQFRERAKTQVENCYLRLGSKRLSLGDFLKMGGPNPEVVMKQLYLDRWNKAIPSGSIPMEPEFLVRARKAGLRGYLTGLAWRKRAAGKNSPERKGERA